MNTNNVWVVAIEDFSDYVAQTWIDTVWDSETKAVERVGELNEDYSEEPHCQLLARFKKMEVM